MHTILCFYFYNAKSIAMLYRVHEYKKKVESTDVDLTQLLILILQTFAVRRYGCTTIHNIVPFTTSCKVRKLLITKK